MGKPSVRPPLLPAIVIGLLYLTALEVAGRLDYHFADWTLVETVSGATSTVDDYLVTGGHV